MSDTTKLELQFLGALVEQLGAQMYPSATATLAELISNAWDADAQNVWVEMQFGESWTPESTITVLDDGHGMTREQAAHAYLVVGRKRRHVLQTDKSKGGRLLHGRKGIGKLAAFGTARILECYTISEDAPDTPTSFRLDYDHIRSLAPGENYETEPAQHDAPLQTPSGIPLDSGTRITLSQLKLKRAIRHETFRESMSRRFALNATEMQIFLNGGPIDRFDYPVEFRLPADRQSQPNLTVEDGWAVEYLTDGRCVRWWIGFTEQPLTDETLQGVSVLARGKMAQRPFFFQRSQGVSGQLGQQYLVGEVQADWLDEGFDIDDDRIQANRDQLQLEDATLSEFLDWGRKLIAWALRERIALRSDKLTEEIEDAEEIRELLDPFTVEQRKALMRIPAALSRSEIDAQDTLRVMRTVVDARDDRLVRQMWEDIDQEAPDVQAQIWHVIDKFGLIDARRNQTVIETRLEAIRQLRVYVREGAREVPTIHDHIKDNTWLLDPRWNLLGDEIHIDELGITYEPDIDPDTGKQMDYLFAMGPSAPSTLDEILVIEIKRGTMSDGSVRRANATEINKFHDYVLAAKRRYEGDQDRPRISGMMIAEDYTGSGREKLQMEIPGARLYFRTWSRVLDEAERLHLGWLAVTTKRAEREEPA